MVDVPPPAVAAAVAGLLASLSAQPPPPVQLHTIGVTAIAQFSSNFLIPQLVDAIERSASSHLTLVPSSFAKTFNTHCLPGISENPSLAASAVVDARKRNHLTDAKFVMTDPSLPKTSGVIYASGRVKVSLCKADPSQVFDCMQRQLHAAHMSLSAPALFLPPDCSGNLSWSLQKLGLVKLQMHVGFTIKYQALSHLLLQCDTVFSDVRLSGFACSKAPAASPAAQGAAAARPSSGCGLLCKVVPGPDGLLRNCSGSFSLFCFHTGIIQINACNGCPMADAQLFAYNLHAFFSLFRRHIEPCCAALADGSRRKRPQPFWLTPPKTQQKRTVKYGAKAGDACLPTQPA